jgi:PmbA protein
MREELLNQAHLAVDLGIEAGANDVVAGISWSRGLKFEWREGRLERVQESTSRRLGLALYVDGRFSTCGTNDLEPGKLKEFAREAVELTRCLELDPHRKITPPELYEGRSQVDLDLVDPALADVTRAQRAEWCQEMDQHARADEMVQTAECSISDSHAVGARASSNGFEGVEEETSVWLYTEVSVQDGDKRPEDCYYAGGSHLMALPRPAEIGDEALRRARTRIGSTKIPSRRTTMVLDPEAGSGLLGRLFGALSAGAIQQQRSFLSGSLNEPVASPLLTVSDDPLRVRGLASRHYDGEGIATRPRAVIEGGVLRTFYVDTYYGRKLGWEPTTGSTSNIVFEHGPRDLSQLIADTPDGIYVTSWLGGNANMTTGDFSFGLRGHLIEDGELTAPVSEMNVTGNYAELMKHLTEVGNDPVPWSSFRTPTLVFEGVQFSGS